MRLFREHRKSTLQRLQSQSWHCRNCGLQHEGIFDLSVKYPYAWEGADSDEPNGALRTVGDFLSEDFCVMDGEHFFVRSRFVIPVHGLEQPFGFGVWSTLSRRNFDIYVDAFDDANYSDWGPWPGYFSNQLDTFGETLNQPCWVKPRSNRQRPLLTLQDGLHPLAVAQTEGITAERLLEIYAAYGHAPD